MSNNLSEGSNDDCTQKRVAYAQTFSHHQKQTEKRFLLNCKGLENMDLCTVRERYTVGQEAERTIAMSLSKVDIFFTKRYASQAKR
jgi:hypothetical protein